MRSFPFEKNNGVAIANMHVIGSNSIIGFLASEVMRKESSLVDKEWSFPNKLIIICDEDHRRSNEAQVECEYVKLHFNVDVVVISRTASHHHSIVHIEDYVKWRE